MKLKLLNEIPQGLFDCKASDLHKLLGGPTLIDIKGESDQTIFMTSLLHGNETSSFEVVKNVLKPYRNSKPPKNIIVFFGNTVAAEKELRHLPDQPDFNRIWEPGPLEENQLAMDVLDYAKTKKMFASLDIHNNTGKNPNYGCINYLDEEFLKMASHFADTTVFFTEPHNANSIAFGRLCPAMTIEAGLSGSVEGIEETTNLANYLLHTDKIEWNEKRKNFEIFHTIARLLVHNEARVDFNFDLNDNVDLSFLTDLDDNNFKILKKGTVIGKAHNLDLLRVKNNQEHDITDEFLKLEDNLIITSRTFVPSMLTQLVYVIKEDCLGYVMELMNPTHRRKALQGR